MTQILLPLGDEACNARPEPYLRLEEPVVVFTGGLGLLRMVQHLLRGRVRVRARVLGLGLAGLLRMVQHLLRVRVRVRVGVGVRARARARASCIVQHL